MFRYLYEALFVVIGIAVIVLNVAYLSDVPLLFPMLNLAGGMIAVIPSLILLYSRFNKRRELEEQFLVFIGDLTESINSGMTLPLALQHTNKRNYGILGKHVNTLSSQVDWGIPFHKALDIFGKRIDSHPVKRAVETIIQTYSVGGNLVDTLRAIGDNLFTLEKLKKERTASVHSQIITSYIIYFVFILILVILQIFLIPSLVPQSSSSGLLSGISGSAVAPINQVFSSSFVNFILIQGLFAGLVTGKMAEGSIVGGVKHSVLLIAIGYTIFSFASQIEVRFI